jgi:hypothetical protein
MLGSIGESLVIHFTVAALITGSYNGNVKSRCHVQMPAEYKKGVA